MTTNPTPNRGEVWRIRFDPAEGDEIKKVRTAVVVSENAVGRLRLKIVVPITEWKPRECQFPLVCTPRSDADQRSNEGFRRRRLSGQVRLGNSISRQAGRSDGRPNGRHRQCHRHLRRCAVTAGQCVARPVAAGGPDGSDLGDKGDSVD